MSRDSKNSAEVKLCEACLGQVAPGKSCYACGKQGYLKPKRVEYVQIAYNGGFPALNGSGFEHGEGVYIVSKNDLDRLLEAFLETRKGEDKVDGQPCWCAYPTYAKAHKGKHTDYCISNRTAIGVM